MKRVVLVVFLIFTLTAIAGLASLAQGEPKYLEKAEVNKTMIQWNKALGVKCSYCHASSDRSETYESLAGKTVTEKELNALVRKRIATSMLGTLLYLNKNENKEYTCNTCHDGKAVLEAK